MIYLQLFWSFLQIGLFSFGGGYAAMPLIQGQVAVSYTHLDVYKRQVQDRWETLNIERQFYVSRCWDTTLAVLDF